MLLSSAQITPFTPSPRYSATVRLSDSVQNILPVLLFSAEGGAFLFTIGGPDKSDLRRAALIIRTVSVP